MHVIHLAAQCLQQVLTYLQYSGSGAVLLMPDIHLRMSILQEELAHAHQRLTQQQQSNTAKIEKKGWEAADWKAQALEATQKLASANAQARPVTAVLPLVAHSVSDLSVSASSWVFKTPAVKAFHQTGRKCKNALQANAHCCRACGCACQSKLLIRCNETD